MSEAAENTINLSHPRMIRLMRQGARYSLFQAFRDIESVADGNPRLGESVNPGQEPLRVAQPANLAFAPTAIQRVDSTESGRVSVEQHSFGMLGPAGALPTHITELVRNRNRHEHDEVLQSFLDLFHHRMALIFYRAWSSSRPAIQRDRPWQDRFSHYLGSISGYGLKQSKHRDRWPDEAKWYFAGRLGGIPRNAEGLEKIVSTTFGVPVKVKPFQLRRLSISKHERTALGRQANCLGRDSLVGSKIADRQSLIELELGPMSYERYAELLPGQRKRKSLEAIVKNYCGISLDANLRLVLKRDQLPKSQLSGRSALGRNAWLRPAECPKNDAADYCQTLTSPLQGADAA